MSADWVATAPEAARRLKGEPIGISKKLDNIFLSLSDRLDSGV